MKSKILLIVGIGVGYVLGARAGRQKYEQIKATAARFWNDPRVQQRVGDVQDYVKDKAPDVAESLADGAKTVVSKVAAARKSSNARNSGASSSTRSTTTKK